MNKTEGLLCTLERSLGERVIDVFLASASFETRCLAVVKSLDVSRVRSAVLGCSVSHLSSLQQNLDSMEAMFTCDIRRLEYFANDPVRSMRSIGAVLGNTFEGNPKCVLMDITTFTRESLLMLLFFFRKNMRSCDKLELLYVPAKEYSLGEEGSQKWLSKGVSEVRSVLGFPGAMRASRSTHMVVMVGFEFERAVEIVNICEPSFVSLGFADGAEQATMSHQELNEQVVEKLSRVFGDVESFMFRSYDIVGTRDEVIRQIEKRPECNVVVAPMHTKISTVGAALLALEEEHVQLCYAPAKIYNVEHYSVASENYVQVYIERLRSKGQVVNTVTVEGRL